MSYKSREKKRQYKAAERSKRAAIGNVRAKHGETMRARHYLTIVIRACCCNGCGRPLRRGAEAVYRNEPKEIICIRCTEERAIKYRTSRTWDRAKGKAAA